MKKYYLDEINTLENTHWWHVSKREIISYHLNKQIKDSKKKLKILEIGAGTANISGRFLDKTEVSVLDVSKTALAYCRKKDIHNLILADFDKYNTFKKNYYDIIICADVLEHMQNDKKALEKIYQMLNTHGLLVIHVPANPKLFSYWDKTLDHFRRYDMKNLERMLTESGYKINQKTHRISFPYPFIALFRKFSSSNNQTSDFARFPLLNPLFLVIARLENFLITQKLFRFPFGTSLFIIAQK
jgi:2-polyprenyl-3-methyl-5-hydroxy-6-metoxy-1,4-benzoquinol methylase